MARASWPGEVVLPLFGAGDALGDAGGLLSGDVCVTGVLSAQAVLKQPGTSMQGLNAADMQWKVALLNQQCKPISNKHSTRHVYIAVDIIIAAMASSTLFGD